MKIVVQNTSAQNIKCLRLSAIAFSKLSLMSPSEKAPIDCPLREPSQRL